MQLKVVNTLEGSNLKGINEEGIKKLVLNIYDYSEQISTILNSIDDLVTDVKEHFQIESSNVFYNKFTEVKNNFGNVRDNILSYADEMLKVSNNFQSIDQDLHNIMMKAAQTVDTEKKYIEQE